MEPASVPRHSQPEHDDSTLVDSVLAGDNAAFATIYERYVDVLFAFSMTMLGNRENAADVVQDVFVIAAERLSQLRNPSKLKAWLYAIARHEIFRRRRNGDRERPVEQLPELPTGETDEPATHAARNELTELVWAACRGLSDRDQAALELHLRHGLSGQELGDAIGVSAAHAHVVLQRARDGLNRSLGVLLLARHGTQDCPQLATLLEHWDGQLTPLIRKRIARHADQCRTCGDQRRRRVNPAALLSTVPILPAPEWLRPRTLDSVRLVSTSRALGDGNAEVSWWPPPDTDRRRTGRGEGARSGEARRALAGAVLLTLLIAVLTIALPAATRPAPTAVPAVEVPVPRPSDAVPGVPGGPPRPSTTDAPRAEPDDPAARPDPASPDSKVPGDVRGSDPDAGSGSALRGPGVDPGTAPDAGEGSRRAGGDGPGRGLGEQPADRGTPDDGSAEPLGPGQGPAADSEQRRFVLPRLSRGKGPPSSTEPSKDAGQQVE